MTDSSLAPTSAGELAGGLRELLLDLGQLFGRPLGPRALEPAPSPREVVDREQDDERPDDDPRRRVEAERVQEDRAEQHDPDHGQPRERLAPAPEAPCLPITPRLVAAHAEPDAHPV